MPVLDLLNRFSSFPFNTVSFKRTRSAHFSTLHENRVFFYFPCNQSQYKALYRDFQLRDAERAKEREKERLSSFKGIGCAEINDYSRMQIETIARDWGKKEKKKRTAAHNTLTEEE